MYYVSDEFKDIIRLPQSNEVVGTLVTKGGVTYQINDMTLAQSDLSISSSCASDNSIEFGSTNARELSFSMRMDVSRYALYDGVVTLKNRVYFNDTHVDIPLGVFNIIEITRDKKLFKFSAVDNLVKLDRTFDTAFTGTPYEVADAMAVKCGITLSQTDYNSFPNHDSIITLDIESGFKSYRNAFGAIAQSLGCFVRADRDGNIEMHPYSIDADVELTKASRYSCVTEDYEVAFKTITANGKNKSYTATSEVTLDGQDYVLKDAPAWDYGLDDDLTLRVTRLMGVLDNLIYTPSKVSIPSDPTIEAGDKVTLVTDNGIVTTILTKVTWHYRSATELESNGKSPYDVESSADSGISRQTKQSITSGKLVYYVFSNATDVRISNTEFTPLVNVQFTPSQETEVLVQVTMEIDFDVNDEVRILHIGDNEVEYEIPGHGDITFRYFYDDMDMNTELTDTVHNGKHIITLVCHLSVETVLKHKFSIKAKVSGCSAVLPKTKLDGVITGQALVEASKWQGLIEREDEYEPISTSTEVHLVDIINSLNISAPIRLGEFTDSYAPTVVDHTVALSDKCDLKFQSPIYTRVTEDDIIRITEDGDERRTE